MKAPEFKIEDYLDDPATAVAYIQELSAENGRLRAELEIAREQCRHLASLIGKAQ